MVCIHRSNTPQMARLFAILYSQTGIDFSNYKLNPVLRCLEQRMSLHDVDDIEEYIVHLYNSPLEPLRLVKEFFIGVTYFFRDPQAFEIVADQVIPTIFAAKEVREPIRVWTPGCSTGEETYSLAMLFHEFMEQRCQRRPIKIFATDINHDALRFAEQGIYPAVSLKNIPRKRLERYFIKRGHSYEVRQCLGDLVTFIQQNIVDTAPFARIDLIVCRNLLIYLHPRLQQQVISTFQFALRRTGFLFLGSSESLGDSSDVFTPVSAKWKIYHYHQVTPEQQSSHQLLAETTTSRTKVRSCTLPPEEGNQVGMYVDNVEQRLRHTRENLQIVFEELATANEKLQAMDEELLATKEELRSVTDELMTINKEYRRKIQELNLLTDDVNNLFIMSASGIILLDANLCVRKFTPLAQKLLNLLEQDIGRPIDHISHGVDHIDLPVEANKVLWSGRAATLLIHFTPKEQYRLEIVPYMTRTKQAEGVILCFTGLSHSRS